MKTSRLSPAQRRTLESAGLGELVTCDLRTARVLQALGMIGPPARMHENRRLVTAKLVSGPLLPDGVMRR
jgi:hypothetical protein